MVAGQNRQEPGAQHILLVPIAATTAAVKQRATLHPRHVSPGRSKKSGKKRQLGVGRRAGLVVPDDVKPTTRSLHSKRFQLRTTNRNLCSGRLTHQVTPPSR